MESEQRDPLQAFRSLSSENNLNPPKTETLQEKSEKKEIALRAVMDGTFEGTVFDSAALTKAMVGGAELSVSQTTYKDYKSRPINEVVVVMKDYQGKILSERVVGFLIDDPENRIENIVKFN